MQPTTGTKTSMWINLLGGFGMLFAGTDWVGLIGKPGSYIAFAVMAANAVLHAFTGNTPVIGGDHA